MTKLKPPKRAKIGLYSMGLKTYWGQFEGLYDRLLEYGEFIKKRMEEMGADVVFYGMVDCEQKGLECGELFQRENVDMIFAHSATYVTSASIIKIHQICKAHTIILNLQPTQQINYESTTTGEWLAHCGACPVPEISNAFERCGIDFNCINGLLGLNYTPSSSLTNEDTASCKEAIRAWKEIEDWIKAANAVKQLKLSRFGYLGNNYSGMLDMYSDYTMLQAQTGIHIELLEMCDLDKYLVTVTDEEIIAKRREIEEFFIISDDNSADPRAKKPTNDQLNWSAKVAVAQEKMVLDYDLDALAYYYHGANDNYYERVQSGFIVGHSLLTAKGIPCAGEGDLKTALAMKICDLLGIGGSFCEIVCTDYVNGTILLGHDGPFHLNIANGKPILRGLGVYHGKRGAGVSVEAKVRTGDITNLNCTQTHDGKLKFIITEAESVDHQIMTIGNTQTHVKFKDEPDIYMSKWFNEYPTHHFAMSVGKNKGLLTKVCKLLNINYVTL